MNIDTSSALYELPQEYDLVAQSNNANPIDNLQIILGDKRKAVQFIKQQANKLLNEQPEGWKPYYYALMFQYGLSLLGDSEVQSSPRTENKLNPDVQLAFYLLHLASFYYKEKDIESVQVKIEELSDQYQFAIPQSLDDFYQNPVYSSVDSPFEQDEDLSSCCSPVCCF